MGVLQVLAPADLRRIVSTYRDTLRAHQDELNRLNVYPVPDGDTGTNMALTLESVVGELPEGDPDMADVCQAIKHGSLMGARGNSGVILSQILRGMADVFAPLESVSGPDLVAGLRRATDAAYAAVLRPVEGTILTVVRSAAESMERAQEGGEAKLSDLLERAASAARDAVASTPDLLPVLRDAGVVDAGGRGFELLLAACLNVVSDRPVPEPQVVNTPAAVAAHLHPGTGHTGDGHGGGGTDADGMRYEVMYFLHGDDDGIDTFKATWDALGDSIVVVGGDGLWNCHVHTNDIGAAIEAGIVAGRPADIRVTDLFEQVAGLEEADWVRAGSVVHVTTAVVAVAVGSGVRTLLSGMGVQQVVAGGQSMNPSTAQILDAVTGCSADGVIVLPNNKNIVPVARQVPELTERPVGVVPTASVVEALAAMIVYDASASLDANVDAMTEAAERVRAGEVTQAVRDSTAECGPIKTGDWIAITRAGIRVATSSAADAAIAMLAELVDDDAELVTLLVGEEADPGETERIVEHVKAAHPDVEL
ncbi:MAG TPA: DAK2 domain-containing protein, partial [Acidimicrobiia bacterium]|nr:DAK2 domain-containing protein [Acidimicrobiia bacterium]